MHFEILVEDASGAILLNSLLDKILCQNGDNHTFRVHSYRGIGRLPKDLRGKQNPAKRILLDQLPRLLQGYGNSLKQIDAAVIVVVDLDEKDCKSFKQELVDILNNCDPKPETRFRIAIEELEAWLLGDREAIKSAYPLAKNNVLESYNQDSICGTWEKLADAIYPGGSVKLKSLGYPLIGQVKCEWASKISPNIDINQNKSKSFQVFRDSIVTLTAKAS
jgi:hypothetical protein